MAGYFPVLAGEAQGLRTGIESLLCQDPSLIAERIDQMDRQLLEKGFYVTFGAEIEFQFFKDPTVYAPDGLRDKDALYLAVVRKLQSTEECTQYGKGKVIMGSSITSPIMLNKFNGVTYCDDPSQADGDISEIRTAPARGNEAINRYWKTINAIAEVAAENGMLGMIISTDFNAATTYEEKYFLESQYLSSARHLAALQRALISLRPLQLDAGIQTGIAVVEAFPHSKDASITVHQEREELQHDLVGVIDPSVDVLAKLYAMLTEFKYRVSAAALKGIRSCGIVTTHKDSSDLLEELLYMGAWDKQAGRLVLPALIESHTRSSEIETNLDELVTKATDGAETSYLVDEGQVIKAIAASLRCTGESELVVHSRSPYAKTLGPLVARRKLYERYPSHRVVPHVIMDSPGLHADRRADLAKSRTVRRILGNAVSKLVPAGEAIERRKELLASMVSTAAS